MGWPQGTHTMTILAAFLFACADLPTLTSRDSGPARDAGSVDAAELSDGGAVDATRSPDLGGSGDRCERPSAAGLRFSPGAQALILDGARHASLGATYTFEAWLRFPDRVGTPDGVVFARLDSDEGNLGLNARLRESVELCLVRFSATTSATLCTGEVIPYDAWVHIAFTVAGPSGRLWVDGVERANGDLGEASPARANLGTTLGATWDASAMAYQLTVPFEVDEFALHDGERYSADFAPPQTLVATAATVGLYRLDERVGVMAHDETGRSPAAMVLNARWLDGCARRDGFGDGSDGAVVITGRVELSRAMQYQDLHVAVGGELIPRGHVVRVRNRALIDGVVRSDGASGSALAGGPGDAAGSVDLRASHLVGAGTLSARGGDATPPGDHPGGAGGRVHVTTEDTLPLSVTIVVDGGQGVGAGAMGATGTVDVERVMLP